MTGSVRIRTPARRGAIDVLMVISSGSVPVTVLILKSAGWVAFWWLSIATCSISSKSKSLAS